MDSATIQSDESWKTRYVRRKDGNGNGADIDAATENYLAQNRPNNHQLLSFLRRKIKVAENLNVLDRKELISTLRCHASTI